MKVLGPYFGYSQILDHLAAVRCRAHVPSYCWRCQCLSWAGQSMTLTGLNNKHFQASTRIDGPVSKCSSHWTCKQQHTILSLVCCKHAAVRIECWQLLIAYNEQQRAWGFPGRSSHNPHYSCSIHCDSLVPCLDFDSLSGYQEATIRLKHEYQMHELEHERKKQACCILPDARPCSPTYVDLDTRQPPFLSSRYSSRTS
jgi:hypothetical protein